MKMYRRATSLLTALALSAMSVGLVGCESATTSADPKPAVAGGYHWSTNGGAAPASSPGQPAARPAAGSSTSSVALPTGERATSVLFLERTAPSQVVLGAPFEYTIKATNIGKLTLSDVVVTDSCSESLKIESSAPQAQTHEGNLLSWDLGTLEPGESKLIRVRAVATDATTVKNCMGASYDQSACFAINVVQPAIKLALTAPAEVLKCDPIPVQLVVTNTGTGTANNVVVEQELPSGLTTADGASKITANVGALGAGESRTINASLRAANTGSFAHAPKATGEGNLTSTASGSTVVKAPKLDVTATGTERAFAGRNATYEVTLTNSGDGDARDTVLRYTLPAGTSLVSASQGSTVEGNAVVWRLGTVKPKDVVKGTVTVKPSGIGELVGSASAVAYCADSVSAPTKTAIEGIPAILLEVVDVSDPIEVGQTETYVITVTNQGSADDTGIVITCTLEDTMEFVSAEGVTAGRLDGKNVVFAKLDRLAPGAKATWRVNVKAIKEGDVRFTTKMESDNLTRPVMETEATNFYK